MSRLALGASGHAPLPPGASGPRPQAGEEERGSARRRESPLPLGGRGRGRVSRRGQTSAVAPPAASASAEAAPHPASPASGGGAFRRRPPHSSSGALHCLPSRSAGEECSGSDRRTHLRAHCIASPPARRERSVPAPTAALIFGRIALPPLPLGGRGRGWVSRRGRAFAGLRPLRQFDGRCAAGPGSTSGPGCAARCCAPGRYRRPARCARP